MENYSVYIHFPFCLTRCPYCDFFSSAPPKIPFSAYRDAVIAEWEWRRQLLSDAGITSLYLGGGTPSLWPAAELRRIMSYFPLTDRVEVTVEVNPGDANRDWFKALVDSGVNRFSIGVQALDEGRLAELGRRHSVDQARQGVRLAKQAGAGAVSADIIYGTPHHTEDELRRELEELVSLGVDHISSYELNAPSGTLLGRRIDAGELTLPDDERMATFFQVVGETLESQGIERYEISNYARPGFVCRHNEHYWKGGSYVGLGCGAHGFLMDREGNRVRYANLGDVAAYPNVSGTAGERPLTEGLGGEASREIISDIDWARERMMLGLRTTKGAPFLDICEQIPALLRKKWEVAARRLSNEGLVELKGRRLRATVPGLLLADGLAEEFF